MACAASKPSAAQVYMRGWSHECVCVYEGATRKYRRHSNKAMQSEIGQNVEQKGPFTPGIKVTLQNFFGLK